MSEAVHLVTVGSDFAGDSVAAQAEVSCGNSQKKKVVIVGGGFAGCAVASQLEVCYFTLSQAVTKL